MAGKYVGQQLPFVGVSRLEPGKAALMVADVKLRYNLLKNHYVTGIFNVAAENDKLSNLLRGRYFYGFGFKYGLDTPLSAGGKMLLDCSVDKKAEGMLWIETGHPFCCYYYI